MNGPADFTFQNDRGGEHKALPSVEVSRSAAVDASDVALGWRRPAQDDYLAPLSSGASIGVFRSGESSPYRLGGDFGWLRPSPGTEFDSRGAHSLLGSSTPIVVDGAPVSNAVTEKSPLSMRIDLDSFQREPRPSSQFSGTASLVDLGTVLSSAPSSSSFFRDRSMILGTSSGGSGSPGRQNPSGPHPPEVSMVPLPLILPLHLVPESNNTASLGHSPSQSNEVAYSILNEITEERAMPQPVFQQTSGKLQQQPLGNMGVTGSTSGANTAGPSTEQLLNWIESVVLAHGGRIIGANLGSALASSNSLLYRTIKNRFGGLTLLLSKFPERFLLSNDPPFNHVSVLGHGYVSKGSLFVKTEALGSGISLFHSNSSGLRGPGSAVMHSHADGNSSLHSVSADVHVALPGPSGGAVGVKKVVHDSKVGARALNSEMSSILGSVMSTSGVPPSSASSIQRYEAPPEIAHASRAFSRPGPVSVRSGFFLGAGGISGSISSNFDAEPEVIRQSALILSDSPYHTLKAVELANTLRARMGTEVLAAVREKHGGLLTLLERHASTFRVHRIPKHDCVSLIGVPAGEKSNVFELPNMASGSFAVDQESNGQVSPLVSVSSASPGSNAASRCLHVGNVSPSVTPEELTQDFSRYGRIETLKIVSQKGRRFAFVNFKSVEEAEMAKSALSKEPMWRGNVSFARRETIAVLSKSLPGLPGAGSISASNSDAADSLVDAKAKWARVRNFVPSRHLWVGNIHNLTRGDLLNEFRRFGPIEDVTFLKDRHCAFIDFVHLDDSVNAFSAMQGHLIRNSSGQSLVAELGFGRSNDIVVGPTGALGGLSGDSFSHRAGHGNLLIGQQSVSDTFPRSSSQSPDPSTASSSDSFDVRFVDQGYASPALYSQPQAENLVASKPLFSRSAHGAESRIGFLGSIMASPPVGLGPERLGILSPLVAGSEVGGIRRDGSYVFPAKNDQDRLWGPSCFVNGSFVPSDNAHLTYVADSSLEQRRRASQRESSHASQTVANPTPYSIDAGLLFETGTGMITGIGRFASTSSVGSGASVAWALDAPLSVHDCHRAGFAAPDGKPQP